MAFVFFGAALADSLDGPLAPLHNGVLWPAAHYVTSDDSSVAARLVIVLLLGGVGGGFLVVLLGLATRLVIRGPAYDRWVDALGWLPPTLMVLLALQSTVLPRRVAVLDTEARAVRVLSWSPFPPGGGREELAFSDIDALQSVAIHRHDFWSGKREDDHQRATYVVIFVSRPGAESPFEIAHIAVDDLPLGRREAALRAMLQALSQITGAPLGHVPSGEVLEQALAETDALPER